MPKEEKVATVNRLKESLAQSKIAIFADFRGMVAWEMSQLREKLKEQQADLMVVKNTLTKIALELLGRKEGIKLLVGPTAIIFGYRDEVSSVKVLAEYKDKLALKGGLMNGHVLSADQILNLATLPPKEVLLGQVIGGIKSPVNLLVFTLSSLMIRLIEILKERKNFLSGGKHGAS